MSTNKYRNETIVVVTMIRTIVILKPKMTIVITILVVTIIRK